MRQKWQKDKKYYDRSIQQWERYHLDIKSRDMEEILMDQWAAADDDQIDFEMKRIPVLPLNERDVVSKSCRELIVFSNSVSTSHVQIALIKHHGYRCAVFNKDGILVRLYSDDYNREWLHSIGIDEWSVWKEELIGPNPFSIGMKHPEGITIESCYCYQRNLVGDWRWLFMPIRNEHNVLIGGLLLFLIGAAVNIYDTEKLLIALVRNMEAHLFWIHSIKDYLDSIKGRGAIALDQSHGRNRILFVNNQTFQIFHQPQSQLFYEDINTIIDPLPYNLSFWEIINSQKIVKDHIIEISSHGNLTNVSLSIARYTMEMFHIDGAVITFESVKRISKPASHFTQGKAISSFKDLIGRDPGFLSLLNMSKTAARYDGNILIQGETGTGKDVLAQAIHNESSRSDGPFVALNCAAFSPELITSELFGYESGAFTGAKKGGSTGKFEMADHGTLFLDEISDMPVNLQATLLRAIEQQSFIKVGGTKEIHVDVRVIAATNQNLENAIIEKRFRQDLYYRLSVIKLRIPPLRERRGDISLLLDYFLEETSSRYGRENMSFSKQTEDILINYDWPGNVRELSNLVHGCVCMSESREISETLVRTYLNNALIESRQPAEQASQSAVQASELTYKKDERSMMVDALNKCKGNRTKAAKICGMSRATFYRRMTEYGLNETE